MLQEKTNTYWSVRDLGKYLMHYCKKRRVITYIKEHLNPRQIFASEDGRLLLVEIQRGKEKILIANVYAPNENQEKVY